VEHKPSEQTETAATDRFRPRPVLAGVRRHRGDPFHRVCAARVHSHQRPQHVTPGRLVVPFVWLVTILIGNTVLLRLSLTPLPRLTGPMRAVDRLDPGERLDATRTAAAAG
jgi:hypothetical protein